MVTTTLELWQLLHPDDCWGLHATAPVKQALRLSQRHPLLTACAWPAVALQHALMSAEGWKALDGRQQALLSCEDLLQVLPRLLAPWLQHDLVCVAEQSDRLQPHAGYGTQYYAHQLKLLWTATYHNPVSTKLVQAGLAAALLVQCVHMLTVPCVCAHSSATITPNVI